ncbi:family 43 glycosylhydrolase [Haloactinomyces albus]|uniref:Beta-xylosidase n=1 Tax=Haloactinomyces albus TaxID=1352928 RepID=A0AAE3Z8I6_9ACTN|nr:family 43 glycosylhydrolase [Haloactinomyces albus]MDR7300291.1 beta-xylosidase [Haloactinomyces albus]
MTVCRLRILSALIILPLVLAMGPGGSRAEQDGAVRGETTNATYYNNAATLGSDPYVLYDRDSGYYYAYSTTTADTGYRFAIHRSPDLATWERLPGGALDVDDGNRWGHDRFRAPEVYHNTETDLYYLFYSARKRDNVAERSGKLGVAVAESPRGPFRDITGKPLDYVPYAPGSPGSYIAVTDPHILFDHGRIYLYFARGAFRRDRDSARGAYAQPSAVHAVELTTGWWHDPTGRTMPRIRPRYVNANKAPGDPPGVRKDGFTSVLDQRPDGPDTPEGENAHVDDAGSGAVPRDRHRMEGPTVVEHHRFESGRRVPVYYLLYSAEHGTRDTYGVGYAVSDSPLGPWRRSENNPVLARDASMGMYSPGHGSVVSSPDGSQLYYLHQARPSPTVDRRLYTERMRFSAGDPDVGGSPSLVIEQSVSDEPVPSGVAPYSLTTNARLIDMSGQQAGELRWAVTSASGAAMDLSRPLNRVRATLNPTSPVTVAAYDDRAVLTGHQTGVAALRLQYQRRRYRGAYVDISNTTVGDDNRESREPVAAMVAVAGCTATITGTHHGPLRVSDGGVTCLRDAVVTGPVRVGPAASLVAVRSAIAGPVEAHRPDAVWISGGTVSGPVRVERATGIVRLEGARVSGRVSVTGSTGKVTIARSIVHGPVSVHGNVGTRSIVVTDNAIDGALGCTGNVPGPAGDRGLNSVRGPASGQCETLAVSRVR